MSRNKLFDEKEISSFNQIDQSSELSYQEHNTFNQGQNCFLRLIFRHQTAMAKRLSNVFLKKGKIAVKDLPRIPDSQKVEINSKILFDKMHVYKQKHPENQRIHPKNFIFFLVKSFSWEIAGVFLQFILSYVVKIFNTFCTSLLLLSIMNNDKVTALRWGIWICINIFLNCTLRQHGWTNGHLLSAKIKTAMIYMLFAKVTSLSSYSTQKANIGKIINLAAKDFNTFDTHFVFLFHICMAPLTITACIVVVWIRLGPWGLVGIIIGTLAFPLQKYLGKTAGKFIQERNKVSDNKIKVCDELFQGIRIIKMYAWEVIFKKMIDGLRNIEINKSLKIIFCQYVERATTMTSALFASIIAFIIIYNTNGVLNAAIIFSSLELFQFMRYEIINPVGLGLQFTYEFVILLDRFLDVMEISQSQQQQILDNNQPSTVIEENPDILLQMKDFWAYWDQDDLNKPILENINLILKNKQLISIIGKVGSGKSSLIQCVLKEVPKYKGYIKSTESIAYVEQEPYIFAGTIKENILFGKELDQQFYNMVVQLCNLEEDFAKFQIGDDTEIGERGINLSGGQKARISFARAIYSQSKLYLLDDPLSAVDAKVGKILFENAISYLKNRAGVLLITHQIHYALRSDYVILLENGKISEQGTASQIEEVLQKRSGGLLISQEEDAKVDVILEDEVDENEKELESNNIVIKDNTNKNGKLETGEQLKMDSPDQLIKKNLISTNNAITLNVQQTTKVRRNSKLQTPPPSQKKQENEIDMVQRGKLTTDEEKEKIEVSWRTYRRYIYSATCPLCLIIVFVLYSLNEIYFTAFHRVLGKYDFIEDKGEIFKTAFFLTLMVFSGNIIKYLTFSWTILTANKNIHEKMLQGLMKTPIQYYDKTPTGRIINKFSNDISIMDTTLHQTASVCLEGPLVFGNMALTILYINPLFFVPLMIETYYIIKWFRLLKPVLIQCKQLDLQSKSPLFSYFSSTLSGITVINVYKQTERFKQKMIQLVNTNNQTYNVFWCISRAFTIYIQYVIILGSTIGIITAIIFLQNDAGNLGQAVLYSMLMIELLQLSLRNWAFLDSSMSSCERTYTLIDLPSEAPYQMPIDKQLRKEKSFSNNNKSQSKIDNTKVNDLQMLIPDIPKWPSSGHLKFQNVFMSYRENSERVLNGVTFEILPGEKVGLIGRTGAGKSSIIQALFRMVEIDQVNNSFIELDGQNTRNIGLQLLRENISIIPQVPFVYNSTIRQNLDPFEQYTDQEILNVLQESHLKEIIDSLPQGLDTHLENVGQFFSVGQKQLLCLARAILKNNKLIVLDEVTANVDMETDEQIQLTIQKKFQENSLLTIAHRINTVADYDKIIVLDQGKVMEIGHPYELLVQDVHEDQQITKQGYFASMVANTGSNNSQAIFDVAKRAYQTKKMHL